MEAWWWSGGGPGRSSLLGTTPGSSTGPARPPLRYSASTRNPSRPEPGGRLRRACRRRSFRTSSLAGVRRWTPDSGGPGIHHFILGGWTPGPTSWRTAQLLRPSGPEPPGPRRGPVRTTERARRRRAGDQGEGVPVFVPARTAERCGRAVPSAGRCRGPERARTGTGRRPWALRARWARRRRRPRADLDSSSSSDHCANDGQDRREGPTVEPRGRARPRWQFRFLQGLNDRSRIT